MDGVNNQGMFGLLESGYYTHFRFKFKRRSDKPNKHVGAFNGQAFALRQLEIIK